MVVVGESSFISLSSSKLGNPPCDDDEEPSRSNNSSSFVWGPDVDFVESLDSLSLCVIRNSFSLAH